MTSEITTLSRRYADFLLAEGRSKRTIVNYQYALMLADVRKCGFLTTGDRCVGRTAGALPPAPPAFATPPG